MISLIAVVGRNNAIGKNNQLLWNIPEDMEHFKKVTLGKTVVMGDRTFLSIGKPLPGRRNIVVTKLADFQPNGVEVRNDLIKLLKEKQNIEEEIFVIGGGQIYAQSLPYAQKLYITLVEESPFDADTFFPDFKEFKNIISEEKCDNGMHKFSFLKLGR